MVRVPVTTKPDGPPRPRPESPLAERISFFVQHLTRPEVEANRGQRLRLLIGTGGLGGFTTYSALALDTATLLSAHPGRAISYALATVALGGAGTMTGIWWSRRRARRAGEQLPRPV